MLVVGAGGAGLAAALAAAEAGARVLVACRAPLGRACNTAVWGGGFMMATETFSVQDHVALTLKAGRGLNDPALVHALAEDANDARRWFEAQVGREFNPKHNGQGYWFTGGGAGFFEALSERVRRAPHVALLENATVTCLLVEDGVCVGAEGVRGGAPFRVRAGATVLAAGGYAGIYARHDNPGDPCGEGLALALAAGVTVRDLEFVQFYPLGLAEPDLPTFMAFRPFPPAARVVNAAGESLTEKHLDTDDLNAAVGDHRDRFSQHIERERAGGPVYLDLRGADWSRLDRWFSLKFLARYDFPWATKPARIAPIAHHCMGGVAIDARGRTDVPGLYAAGEAAAGLHGANRLGSNSLSACLVFGRRAGSEAARSAREVAGGSALSDAVPDVITSVALDAASLDAIQRCCWEHLGLFRDRAGLLRARERLRALASNGFKARCARTVAEAVAAFALRREESRGAHARSDFPEERVEWGQSLFARMAEGRFTFVDSP